MFSIVLLASLSGVGANISIRIRSTKHLGNFVDLAPGRSANDIEPLKSFDYRCVEPIRYRPFRNKTHVKMAIAKMPRNDWIKIDRHYLERINRRKELLRNNHQFCIGSNELARLAIRELYGEVMVNQLPKRFPTMFSIRRGVFTNHITGCKYSVSIVDLDDTYMLDTLAENVEEDFYFMIPDGNGEYRLQAYMPSYESRLGNGVDKSFRRMEPGLTIMFIQWSIQTDGDELFKPLVRNTFDPDAPGSAADPAVQRGLISFEKTYLRCEHHTLTCLPETKTVMFCVRTYLTPIKQIKDEGNGSALADACDTMPEKFGVYKRRPVWGHRLCEWMRDGERKDEDTLLHDPVQASQADGQRPTR
ncbi:MAG: hypothetical protein L6R40_006850 [Gallowayella cf. fulva]|nr:MAG: hypothetical protein L6R40_006850 [Xanthomendoza cf. fulva]